MIEIVASIIGAVIAGIFGIVTVIVQGRKSVKREELDQPITSDESQNASLSQEDMLRINKEGNIGFRNRVKDQDYNVYLTTKIENEDKKKFPLGDKLAGIQKLTLLNFAASTFLSGEKIAKVYSSNQEYTEWFQKQVLSGALEVNVIINDPHSYAAKDAATNKMNPRKLIVPSHEIIVHNINTLLLFREQNPNADIKLYLTDICLPYGIMLGENYSDHSMDFMKVDLYSPLGGNDDTDGFDDERPSFYMLYENDSTSKMFGAFKKAINRIQVDKEHTRLYQGPDVRWMREKPFIHKGMYREHIKPHSVKGYIECIRHGYPFEIDILFLRDGTPIVAREIQLLRKDSKEENDTTYLSAISFEELKAGLIDHYILPDNMSSLDIDEMITLKELLSLVDGKVGLLIEVKVGESVGKDVLESYAKKILDTLKYYKGRFAIQSSNPWLLKEIRQLDRTIALGQISWSFQNTNVSDDDRRMHQKFEFLNIIDPDFIAYKLEEIPDNEQLIEVCERLNFLLLAWTIRSAEDERKAKELQHVCDNIIIEGATTFL